MDGFGENTLYAELTFMYVPGDANHHDITMAFGAAVDAWHEALEQAGGKPGLIGGPTRLTKEGRRDHFRRMSQLI